MKILIYIVSYNAENFIQDVLKRIPHDDLDKNYTVLISDDASADKTVQKAQEFYKQHPHLPIEIVTQPKNLQYGGNQKYGYNYAIANKYDIIVLLHGDGQYPPEMIPDLLDYTIKNSCDVVLGSRMVDRKSALRGGMPMYKYIGNIVLTTIQNYLLGTKLSEFHTGFRVYRIAGLKKLLFNYNSNDFSFDTEILIQAVKHELTIGEISIPTHYGEEVCRVNGIVYACKILWFTLAFKLHKYNIIKYKRFQ